MSVRRLSQVAAFAAIMATAWARAAAQATPLRPLPPPSTADEPPPSPPSLSSAAPASDVDAPAPWQGRASSSTPDPDDIPPKSKKSDRLGSSPPPTPDPWATNPLAFELQFGLGAPLGFLGLAFDYSPVPALGLDLGVGAGWAGIQYAFSARLRVIRVGRRTHFAPYLGAGVSAGAYDTPISLPIGVPVDGSEAEVENPSPHFHWNTAYWTNFEAGGEWRVGPHVSLRPCVGASLLLNPRSSSIVRGQDGESPTGSMSAFTWVPYVGFALGYAMEI